MITVLIAEDELLVRMGIMSMVNWEKMDMSVIACVGDGIAALKAAQQFRPDILITDIVMPGIDGIRLLHSLRESGLSCPCIVITALHQRQALENACELGIVACLVKATMTQQEVISALMLAKAALQVDPEHERDVAEMHQRRARIEAAYAAQLTETEIRPADSIKPARPSPIDNRHAGAELLMANVGAYVLGRVRAGYAVSTVLGGALSRLTSEVFAEYGVLCIASRGNRMLLVLERPIDANRTQLTRSLLELREYVERNLVLLPDFAILTPVVPDMPLPDCIALLNSALAAATHGVVWADEVGTMPISADERAEFCERMYCSLWALIRPERIHSAWRALVKLECPASTEVVLALAWTELSNALGLVHSGDTRELMRKCIELAETSNTADGTPPRRELGISVRLVLDNLAREVKLSEVAHAAGFHEVYFSSLFKRYLGMGYSRFSNALRIEHAKYLMRERHASVSEAARQCGYNDISYFSRVFKQAVGMSPSMWRGSL